MDVTLADVLKLPYKKPTIIARSRPKNLHEPMIPANQDKQISAEQLDASRQWLDVSRKWLDAAIKWSDIAADLQPLTCTESH